jgi:leucyl-tRNA synthetase
MKKSDKNSVKNSYNPAEIELKWQSKWEKERTYHSDLDSANGSASSPLGHFYNLMMFPYPSAEGMHAGNFFTFTGADTYGRFKRMQGYDVFEPIGLDGFGIHSENYAIKVGSHPLEQSKKSEENFYRQFHATGNMYDYERTVETYKPDYYKWTQWVFVELFKKGLAYRKKSPVNFCPSCKTVLADEQVIDGKCERCSSVVEKKNLEQWFFRITKYADRLLANIEDLDWTEKVKIAQRNWIGKKDGINITYKLDGIDQEVEVFTTRPDTNFGATFIALAPEHHFVEKILKGEIKSDHIDEIQGYVEAAKSKSDIERQSEGKEKTGVFTGFYAINQLTGFRMPVWVSDFVLMGFGTGALVGVPGHDKRDFEFAQKFDLKIIRVVTGSNGDESPIEAFDQVQEEEGRMINSEFLNGMEIHEATGKIMDYMEEKGYGRREVTYHLRDWLISRQRYWGPPIPMIYCPDCADKGLSWFNKAEAKDTLSYGLEHLISDDKHMKEVSGWYPVEEKDLPVELPYIEDFKPLETPLRPDVAKAMSGKQGFEGQAVKSPLGNHPEFYEVKCPHCGGQARRETDVSDTFLDSAWYFLRYLATDRDDIPFPMKKDVKRDASGEPQNDTLEKRLVWLPVTMYIGGAEHSVLHLLYARFITMVFKDLGFIDFEEPFKRFYAHGLIIKDGAKMSKSKGNIINPDEYIKKFGADTLRMYLRFLAPFDQSGDFRDSGIEGMHRFVKKIWKLFNQQMANGKPASPAGRWQMEDSADRLRMMHQTIKKVTEEMEALRFNTAIAQLMTWYNFLSTQAAISREEAENYLKMLAPFAPHMSEELFQLLRNSKLKTQNSKFESIHTQAWPKYEEKYLVADTVTIPVQVNGKLRGALEVGANETEDQKKIEELAKKDANVSQFLEGKAIKKTIYIKGKVINFVV